MNVSKYAQEWSAKDFYSIDEVECFIRFSLPFIKTGEYQLCFNGIESKETTQEGTEFIADTMFIGDGVFIFQNTKDASDELLETYINYAVDESNAASIAEIVDKIMDYDTSDADLIYFG